jgi:hypothetical protein
MEISHPFSAQRACCLAKFCQPRCWIMEVRSIETIVKALNSACPGFSKNIIACAGDRA